MRIGSWPYSRVFPILQQQSSKRHTQFLLTRDPELVQQPSNYEVVHHTDQFWKRGGLHESIHCSRPLRHWSGRHNGSSEPRCETRHVASEAGQPEHVFRVFGEIAKCIESGIACRRRSSTPAPGRCGSILWLARGETNSGDPAGNTALVSKSQSPQLVYVIVASSHPHPCSCLGPRPPARGCYSSSFPAPIPNCP